MESEIVRAIPFVFRPAHSGRAHRRQSGRAVGSAASRAHVAEGMVGFSGPLRCVTSAFII
jgi:hypothetical protein